MFTGIIEEVGNVKSISARQTGSAIFIEANKVLGGTRIGDSIAVNGVCLTVSSFSEGGFSADVMPETLRKSNLGKLKTHSPVNLERALALGERLGGHMVSGHVDGVGTVLDRKQEGNAVIMTFKAPADVLRLIISKGSIAVDGVSLTVAGVSNDSFSVSLVSHTLHHTTLESKMPGTVVNLENDMLAKYVERLLDDSPYKGELSMELLRTSGFIQ